MKCAVSEGCFEQRSKRIQKYLCTDIRYNKKILKRPFFFEFTGTPSAGKTTTITELDKFLRKMDFRVYRPPEGAEVIRHITRDTPLFNIRTGNYSVDLLMDLSQGHQYDIVLLDRGPYDAYCWMIHWREKGLLTPHDQRLYQRYYLSRLWTQYIDVAYFMVCSAEAAIQRELKNAPTRKLGSTTNPESIQILETRYRQAFRQLRQKHPQLRFFDTTRFDERSMVDEIANQLLVIMEKKAANR